MAEANSYEEQRRRQVEENRRKLEELRLHHLSAAVREAAARPKPKPKPRPKRKAPGPGELRRSGRVAGLPEQPNYLESAQQRDYRGVYEAYAVWKGPTDEERARAIAKAEELRNRLNCSSQPAFVKRVTQSLRHQHSRQDASPHSRFSEYLPAHGETVVLTDEAGDEFATLHNANRPGKYSIKAGWKGFVVRHELADGDSLVFQLTERTEFKVYIIRASSNYKNNQTSDDEDEY